MSLFSSDILSLFFPGQCVGCGVALSEREDASEIDRIVEPQAAANHATTCVTATAQVGRHWCRRCWARLSVLGKPQCCRCSAARDIEVSNPLGERCAHCFDFELRFDQAFSLGNYSGLLQKLVVQMKNLHDDQLGIQLGRLLFNVIQRQHGFDGVDMILPVPIHWRRRLSRGFCAPEIVADVLGQQAQVPVSISVLQASRLTQKQGQTSLGSRATNVRNAFRVKTPRAVEGKNVLLIDDVMTSGATCNEITRILRVAGANRIVVGVIARATGVR